MGIDKHGCLQQIIFGAPEFSEHGSLWSMLCLLPCTEGRPAEQFVVLSHTGSQPIVMNQGNTAGGYTGQYIAGRWSAGGASDIASGHQMVGYAGLSSPSFLTMAPLDQSLCVSEGDSVVWLCVRFLLLSG